jgi:cation diffusion facilitator CzcD-associated flavoprotein CzcO
MTSVDVAIVGSGPHALSLAAHLRARRVDHRIFGPPMHFWRTMPPGLNLKSYASATSISVPERGHTFPEWCRARNLEDHEPCTMETYAEYGMWMKDRFVPHVEDVMVKSVTGSGAGYEVTLANGETLRARNVVSATGLSGLKFTPPELQKLPEGLTTHTADLHKSAAAPKPFERFKGKHVAVLGAGASAIEAAALVCEAGGTSVLLVRGGDPLFMQRTPRNRSLKQRLLQPDSDLGTGRKNWVLQNAPFVFWYLPEQRRTRVAMAWAQPSAPWWIADRFFGKVEMRTHTTVVGAKPQGEGVRLRLTTTGKGESDLDADHVIAGTGYTFDVDLVPYLDEGVRRSVRRIEQAPELSLSFESSRRGLYFMGPMSVICFGPLFRFVCGAKVSAPAIAKKLARARS